MHSTKFVKIPEINLQTLCRELSAGNCIGLPTETVYGLAADATNGIAVAKIFEMKGRPQFNPLICHVADLAMAERYGSFDVLSRKLAEAFWPGPLTLVVSTKKSSGIHPLVTGGLETVGLRSPKGLANELIQQFGKPLAAPSANRSGKISPTTAQHVAAQFPEAGLTVIDAGPCEVGLESTIIKVEDRQAVILRHGSITAEMIAEKTGVEPIASDTDKIEAPGMMKSHYAPDAQVLLNCTDCPSDARLLKFGNAYPDNNASTSLNLSMSGDLREAAANLYGFMMQLDSKTPGTICVEPIPMTGLGIAINDRLTRAAAPRGTE